MITENFISGKNNKVVIFYNHFVNTISQIAVEREFLPLEASEIK
jgi:F0F1-type ATP synthase gamma subunit